MMESLDQFRRVARGWLRCPAFLRARRLDARLMRKAHHELAACAIFREEAPFLEEWLRFHEAVGITKFYLYNNFSTDSFAEVLSPFIACGDASTATPRDPDWHHAFEAELNAQEDRSILDVC